MSGKASLRIIESLEKARIEGDWSSVSQYAEQLPREYSTLRFVSLGECLLEQRGLDRQVERSNSLLLARDYISKALQTREQESQHYKEAILLQAKTFYIQGKFKNCIETFNKVNMEHMRKESLSFNVTKALADAFVYRGMALEHLKDYNNTSFKDVIAEVIACYEAAGDLGLELLHSISKSTLKLTISGVLELALIRSVLLQLSHGMVDEGIYRLRKILQLCDIPGSEQLRLSLALTLGQVLVQGIPERQWTPTVQSRDTVTACDTLTKRGRHTPTQKKYESVFCPCNKVEEAILVLLISQALLYKDGVVSFHQDDKVEHEKTKKQVHRLLNMMVVLMSKYGQYRHLVDALEKVLKFSHDDHHICVQFGLALVASGQTVRGAAALEKCLFRNADAPVALVLAKTYINKLNRFDDAIKLCEKYLMDEQTPTYLKAKLHFLQGVAEAAICRIYRLTLKNQQHSKSSIANLFKAYSIDPRCPRVLYHLALRLAAMGEIKKSIRFVHKALDNPGVCEMVDCSHLLVLLLSAQKRHEEALDMTLLTLLNYPGNLNLLITKVHLQKLINGSSKALLTSKEVLLPLLEKYSAGAGEMPEPVRLPYSDEWTGGKFQLTQWSDRVSTHTTASYTGSNMGTVQAESICESIDSVILGDQNNWGFQAEVWFTIADVFISLDMLPDAQKCIDEIKTLFPLSHLVSYMSGRIREKEGMKEEAEQQYVNAVTLSPRHIPSLVGRLQLEMGKELLAEHNLSEASKLGTAVYQACFYLGQLYQKQGSHDKASEYFMASIRFESSSPIRPYSVLKWTV